MRSFAFGIISLLAVIPFIYGETQCQQHKRNAGRSAHGLEWDIKCDEQGDYEPLQCTKDTPKWCKCYDKNEAVTGPSMKLKTCDCPLARDEHITVGQVSPKEGCPSTPKCTQEGKFEPKQCCAETGKCRCVNKETGTETVAPTSDRSVTCPN